MENKDKYKYIDIVSEIVIHCTEPEENIPLFVNEGHQNVGTK